MISAIFEEHKLSNSLNSLLNGSSKSNTKVLNEQKPRFVTAEPMSMIERISLNLMVDAQTSKV